MKKILFLFVIMVSSLLTTFCFAATPEVSAKYTQFNPLTGVYQLEGQVTVKLPGQIIVADQATVYLYQQKVSASGNVHLSDTNINFWCDQVQVAGSENIAFCSGNCLFRDGNTTIISQTGSFNWKTKLAIFNGNVKVNDASYPDETTYNVTTKQIQ